jgi:indoleamine 2,3-dioxygenase
VGELPQQLAVPWFEVSDRCGVKPVASYTSAALWNCCLKDESKPPSLDNMKTLFSFSGTRSEEWFYLVPLATEIAAVPGVKAAVDCFNAVEKGNTDEVVVNLKIVSEAIKAMTPILQKMYDECIPDEFFQLFRPFQGGTTLSKAFPNGLVYKGVDETPKKYGGASAGQNSTVPVFDILLGIQHSGGEKEFFNSQRWHMPRQHRQFLLYLSQRPSLKEFVMQNKYKEDLLGVYNQCIANLREFRSEHVELVQDYIINHAQKKPDAQKEDGGLDTKGTGGTDLGIFLQNVLANTVPLD